MEALGGIYLCPTAIYFSAPSSASLSEPSTALSRGPLLLSREDTGGDARRPMRRAPHPLAQKRVDGRVITRRQEGAPHTAISRRAPQALPPSTTAPPLCVSADSPAVRGPAAAAAAWSPQSKTEVAAAATPSPHLHCTPCRGPSAGALRGGAPSPRRPLPSPTGWQEARPFPLACRHCWRRGARAVVERAYLPATARCATTPGWGPALPLTSPARGWQAATPPTGRPSSVAESNLPERCSAFFPFPLGVLYCTALSSQAPAAPRMHAPGSEAWRAKIRPVFDPRRQGPAGCDP